MKLVSQDEFGTVYHFKHWEVRFLTCYRHEVHVSFYHLDQIDDDEYTPNSISVKDILSLGDFVTEKVEGLGYKGISFSAEEQRKRIYNLILRRKGWMRYNDNLFFKDSLTMQKHHEDYLELCKPHVLTFWQKVRNFLKA